MHHGKISVMGYRMLFEVSGIHYSNTGLQITKDMYINGNIMYSLTSHLIGARQMVILPTPTTQISKLLRNFNKPLPEAITCLLYLEFDN